MTLILLTPSPNALRTLGDGVGGSVGVRAGFDDGAVEREAVYDRGPKARVGEGFGA
jgi:hypothetical protein